MPKIIKNNIVYGSGAKYVEITQLQYDQLTDAEKHNGKMYFITDTNGDEQDFQPVIYSTTEREIGVFVDGKPLYEKTLVVTSGISTNAENSIPHGISNIGDCRFPISGYIVRSSGDYTPIPATSIGGSTYYNGVETITDTNVVVWLGSYLGQSISKLIVTIRYTKSTDTVGSGTWTPQGIPARHYSSNEAVIGTWIDGSTMYSKTITIYPITKDGADHYVNHNISNVNLMLGYEAFFSKSSTGRCCDKNTDQTLQYECNVFEANRTQVGYAIGSGWDFDYCYVTLKYNKTV